jgi:hypothetical protein
MLPCALQVLDGQNFKMEIVIAFWQKLFVAAAVFKNPGEPSIKDNRNEMQIDQSDVCYLDGSSRCECTADHRYGQDHMWPIPRYAAGTVG